MRKTKEDYIGMTKMMNCGLNATIIAYRNVQDIDVQFETGTVRKHVCTCSFKKGSIAEKIFTDTKYIGQTKMMNCGVNATIIAYRNSKDIDVQFETGIIREHVCTCSFKKGEITEKARVTAHSQTYIGQTQMMNCGLNATIIAYRKFNDIDVQFETGTVRKHISINNFTKGRISEKALVATRYIGQSQMMNCGLNATIIAYRNAKDIDVQFETGTVRKHVCTDSFKKGSIAEKARVTAHSQTYIGQTQMMNCGLNATIIAYRNSKDMDVQFETGTVRKHVNIGNFTRGRISEKSLVATRYIGQSQMMNCGLNAMIIAYRNSKDIDVQFETGTVRKHVNISNFTRGEITYPEAKLFGIYTIQKQAFVFHNKTYFCVSYTENKTEVMDIMSIDDMKNRMNEIS